MNKGSKGQRELENSGGGLLPAVEGDSLEQNRHLDDLDHLVVRHQPRTRQIRRSLPSRCAAMNSNLVPLRLSCQTSRVRARSAWLGVSVS